MVQWVKHLRVRFSSSKTHMKSQMCDVVQSRHGGNRDRRSLNAYQPGRRGSQPGLQAYLVEFWASERPYPKQTVESS